MEKGTSVTCIRLENEAIIKNKQLKMDSYEKYKRLKSLTKT